MHAFINTKYHSFDEYLLAENKPDLSGEVATQLMWIYRKTVEKNRPVILELGTDRGASTTVFLQACEERDGRLVSIDITDCSDLSSSSNWQFVQADSANVDYILSTAPHLKEGIDILYIDSLHTSEHVEKEITGWFPYLNRNAWVFFDDVDSHPYRKNNRKDNVRNEIAWDHIHEYVKCFFYANEDSLKLNILYGSTGLACLNKLSPRGSLPAKVIPVPHRGNAGSLRRKISWLCRVKQMKTLRAQVAKRLVVKGILSRVVACVARGGSRA